MFLFVAAVFIPTKNCKIRFYSIQMVCGNVEAEYRRETLDAQLKTEFIQRLQPAFGKLSELEIRPNQIATHSTELENAMK
jgi:hypothetical protein